MHPDGRYYSEWEERHMFNFCSKNANLNSEGKKKKKKSTLEEEIIMYMYKTAIHSFT